MKEIPTVENYLGEGEGRDLAKRATDGGIAGEKITIGSLGRVGRLMGDIPPNPNRVYRSERNSL